LEDELDWAFAMSDFDFNRQAPAAWLFLQAFPACNQLRRIRPVRFWKMKEALYVNQDLVLLEKASLELYFFFLDQMKTKQSLVYDVVAKAQHWIQQLPRTLDKGWFNDKNGFRLIKKAIRRLPFVGVWPSLLLNLLYVPKTQLLFKAFPWPRGRLPKVAKVPKVPKVK